MAQEYITINGTVIKQPDELMPYNFEVTDTADSGRVQTGVAKITPLFTVEAFSYSATSLTKAEMSTILQLVARGTPFTLHYFSPFYGTWRDDIFYVGKGSLKIQRLTENSEHYDSLSFNMIGVNPI